MCTFLYETGVCAVFFFQVVTFLFSMLFFSVTFKLMYHIKNTKKMACFYSIFTDHRHSLYDISEHV